MVYRSSSINVLRPGRLMTTIVRSARFRMLTFLDGCRQQPGVRSMLLQARALPEIAELVRERNDEAAQDIAVDLAGVTPSPRDTARLLVAATAEAALQELEARKRLPRMRAALLAMMPGYG